MRCLAALAVLSLAAQAKTVTYAVAIGNNSPPVRADEGALPTLRFADDDAVRYDAFFARTTDHHWLLSVLDAPTQRRYPDAAGAARPPTLQALRALVQDLAARMKADRARGDEPVLYLTYSGHGAQRSDGTVFLTLLDGALTREVLYDDVLAPLPASFVHLFVDACHAEAVVGARGLFSKERDGATTQLAPSEVETVVGAAGLRRFPQVGVLMATTEEQESHEWSQLQSGIFTHELLSALSGAADVNGDGVVEYSEVQAFVVSANRAVKDPRALPRVVASPPALNPRAPLVALDQLKDVVFLEDDFSSLGHFHVELDDGERYLDANLSAERGTRLALPARRLAFVVSQDREAALQGRPRETKRLADLSFQPRRSEARGSIETSFRTALFASPYGPTYYRGFVDSAQVTSVTFVAPRVEQPLSSALQRNVPSVISWALGGGALVTSGILGLLALQAQRDFAATSLQRSAEEARQRFSLFGNAALITAGAAVALGVVGFLTWSGPSAASPVTVVPTLGPEGFGVALSVKLQ